MKVKKPMRTHWVSICGMVALTASLGACGAGADYLDPYKKPYTWQPTGAPTANLAAQLVNPHDLVSGRGGPEGNAKASSLAIGRIWQDNLKTIASGPGDSGSGGGTGASGGGTGASGAGPGGSGASGGGTN